VRAGKRNIAEAIFALESKYFCAETMDDPILLRLEVARLLRVHREHQLAECDGLVFKALVRRV
jgi:hypothetical protein